MNVSGLNYRDTTPGNNKQTRASDVLKAVRSKVCVRTEQRVQDEESTTDKLIMRRAVFWRSLTST